MSYDLETLSGVTYPRVVTFELNGLSPTFRTDEVVAVDTNGKAVLTRMWPTPTVIDTVSVPNDIAAADSRQLARLSDSVWLRTTAHYTVSYFGNIKSPGGLGWRLEDPSDVVISPRGDLTAVAVPYAPDGVPVFDNATGQIAYRLGTGYLASQGAAFSPDGEKLYLIAGPMDGHIDSLLTVRATSGETLAISSLPGGQGFDLAADPESPLLYVQLKIGDRPTIRVYDAENLTLLGELPTPLSTPLPDCSSTCWRHGMAVDRVRNRLYVVWEGTSIWSFDLLP